MAAIDINTIQKSTVGQIALGVRPGPGAPSRGGNFALVLGVLAAVIVGGAAGAVSFFDANVKKDIEAVNAEVASFEQGRDRSQEARLLAFNTQLKTLRRLLDQHTRPGNIFEVLEGTTLPETTLKSFTWSDKGRLTVVGETANYSTLGKQLVAYGQDSRIAGVDLTSFGQGSGSAFGFTIALSLKPEVVLAATSTRP